MSEELRGIIPKVFKPFLFPLAYQQVIVDWLLWETIQSADLEAYPILKELTGWRRKEIMNYCESQHHIWDARIAAIYGSPGAIV
jgi:hypothetical protein